MGKLEKYAIPIIAIIFFYLIIKLLGLETNCYFKAFFGIPCPGCGLTRAYLALLKGNILGAFYWHPLFLVPLIAIMYIFNSRIRRNIAGTKFWTVIAVIFIATWMIRMVLLFPNKEPMVFYKKAILPSLFSKFINLF